MRKQTERTLEPYQVGGPPLQDLKNLELLKESCLNGDVEVKTDCARRVRKMLSIEQEPPVAQVVAAGFVPILHGMLGDNSKPKLQFEALWALTNVGSSNLTGAVCDEAAANNPLHCNCVPDCVRLLSSPHTDVQEQAIWCLGNIAGDSPVTRDMVLRTPGVCEGFIALFTPGARLSLLRNTTWAMSNLCRGKPRPLFSTVSTFLPVLSGLVYCDRPGVGGALHNGDEEILTDACWALSYLSDGPNNHVEAVLQSGVLPALVKLLRHTSKQIVTPSLRTLGNVVTGNDSQTQRALDAGFLPAVVPLLWWPVRVSGIE